jgi:hypothetical protein
MSDRRSPNPPPPSAGQQPLPTGTALLAGVLLAIPVIALLLVPTYANEDPHLWGFPFFYWYQFAWVFLASGFTFAAYAAIQRARRGDRR